MNLHSSLSPSFIHQLTFGISRLMVLIAISLMFPQLRADTPFTYQGRLDSNGTPYNGIAAVRIGLFASQAGIFSTRTETIPNVTITNGLFTVSPSTFVPTDFGNADGDWLELEVSTDGGVIYTKLTPRQRVTFTPLAMTAEQAKSLVGMLPASQISGSLPSSQISGGIAPHNLTSGYVINFLNFFTSGGQAPFSVTNNTVKVDSLNVDLLDGLDSTAFLRTTGGTLSGNLGMQNPAVINFGTSTRQMLNLYNAEYGIGVQGDTLYLRSQNDWSWHRGGIHSNIRNAAGTGGTEVMRLSGNDLWLDPKGGVGGSSSPPRLVFGNLSPLNAAPYVSVGEAPNLTDTLQLTADKVLVTSNSPGYPPAISFGETTGQHLVLYENSYDTYGMGVQGDTLYFRTGEQFAWFKDGSHSNVANDSGSGTTLMTLSRTGVLTPNGGIDISFGQSVKVGLTSINNSPTSSNMQLNANSFIFRTLSGDQIGSISSAGNLDLDGTISTTVLTIRGGADVAEPFEMTKPEDIEAGSVVVIDEDLPGQLKLSTESYDNKVAGIISGAGGVKPGLRLHQEGVLEGDHHVALSGRVYVKADASTGPIKPGDLLTTSAMPGHAMKVINHSEAQGAILGKAMSRLDHGTGLVLVLVTLQ